jgi:hypothetical protein
MSARDGKCCKVASFDVARYAVVSRAAVSRTFTPDASVLSNLDYAAHLKGLVQLTDPM